MWILGNPTRPGPRNCHDLRSLLPTPRAAQPRSERFECHFPADQARERLRLDLTDKAAIADDTHHELAEGIVQFGDVGEDAHGRMGLLLSLIAFQVREPCGRSPWKLSPFSYTLRAQPSSVVNSCEWCIPAILLQPS